MREYCLNALFVVMLLIATAFALLAVSFSVEAEPTAAETAVESANGDQVDATLNSDPERWRTEPMTGEVSEIDGAGAPQNLNEAGPPGGAVAGLARTISTA